MTPFNFVTMTEYAGRNSIDLSVNEYPAYATFNQIKTTGGTIKKGSKGYHIFCGFRDKLDKKTGKTVSMPTSATVFHIEQCELPDDYLLDIATQAADGNVIPSLTRLNAEILTAVFA